MDEEERKFKTGIIHDHMVAQWDDEEINKLWDYTMDCLEDEQEDKGFKR
jgi:hypothetical protein